MSGNEFGEIFKLTTFGESHGPAVGALIQGCPAGVIFDQEILQKNLIRRRPGAAGKQIVSARQEMDTPEILSGVFEDKTLGTPITILVRNTDARSKDYDEIKENPRKGHADQAWREKFAHVDYRGGGRASGRETVGRVIGGSVAEMVVKTLFPKLKVYAFSSAVGPFSLTKSEAEKFFTNPKDLFERSCYFPGERESEIKKMLMAAQENGESWGGNVGLLIQGAPAGLGQPVFRKLKSDFAKALVSVGSVVSYELGRDLDLAQTGSAFHNQQNFVYGGVNGGISNGQDIFLEVGIKPTSSILDVSKKGRHDPCLLPRVIPVLQSMIWLTLCDHILWSRLDRI